MSANILRAQAGRVIYVEATLARDGQPVDTTQAQFKAWFTLKESKDDPDTRAVYAGEISSGITPNEPSTSTKNHITCTIESTATAAYTESVDLVWDLVIDDPSSNRGPETIEEGILKLTAPVTRVPA